MTHLWHALAHSSDPIISWPRHTFIPLYSVLQILQPYRENRSCLTTLPTALLKRSITS